MKDNAFFLSKFDLCTFIYLCTVFIFDTEFYIDMSWDFIACFILWTTLPEAFLL